MSLIWGLTWIAIKIGVLATPPFFFGAARLLAAGALLMILARARGRRFSWRSLGARVVVAAILVNAAGYGFLFWGMQYVPSGLSAVVNLSLIPVGLFLIGVVLDEEDFSYRKSAAILLGVIGLTVLFTPRLLREGETAELWGMLAILAGTGSYCWGSVLSRPLLRELDAFTLNGLYGLIGGAGLAALSIFFEQVDGRTLEAFAAAPVVASWLFLAVGGSVVGFTIYLALIRDWGPTRAGLYAFVSPIVAVSVGVFLYAEPFGGFELSGSAIMLMAAGLAVREKKRQRP
jgi:drug/metabolite transporter (DMT)-like permease